MFLTTHSRMRAKQARMFSLAVVLLLHLVAFTVTPYFHLALQPTGAATVCCPASDNTGEGLQAGHGPHHHHANCSICQTLIHGQQLHPECPAGFQPSANGFGASLAFFEQVIPIRPDSFAYGARGPPAS